MQQRYYDPLIGRFLSVDPVTAYSKGADFFNRYKYANNNPYRFTDPDGREVVYAYGEGISASDGRRFMISVAGFSETAHSEMRQLEESGKTYTVLIDNNVQPGYDPNTRTVRLNPSYGFRIKSTGQVQSPKVNSGHEITHAAEHDRVGDKAFGTALKRPTNSDGTKGVSPEEKRATIVERKIGEELGEPTRKDYKDAGDMVKCNPKATTGC
jgi:uncharacterized protein RhaS with RHS repeats